MAKQGRPTKYKPEYCNSIVEYFESSVSAGWLPFLSRWAREIAGVCEDTAIEWTKEHPEFSEAYKKAKDIQKEVLVEGALTGKFNPTFSIFTAKNITDMRDVQETKNQTDVHLSGFERLKDDELDAVIAKFKTELGQRAPGEIQAGGAESPEVRMAAREAAGGQPE